MEEVPKRLEGSGIAVGTTLVDVDEIEQKIDWGYRFLNVGSPIAVARWWQTGNCTRVRAAKVSGEVLVWSSSDACASFCSWSRNEAPLAALRRLGEGEAREDRALQCPQPLNHWNKA